MASLASKVRSYLASYGLKALVREVSDRAWRKITRNPLPPNYQIEISNTCNFDCSYCLLKQETVGPKTMKRDVFERMLPYVKGARSVSLSGLAEPLMNKQFVEYLQAIRSVAPHITISLVTNGSLLTPEIAEAMVKNRLNNLSFSLDGTDASVVDAIRSGGSLETIVSNITMLNETKRRLGSDLPVLTATCVLQADNLSQLPDLIELGEQLEVTHISVNGLEPYGADLVKDAPWVDGAIDRALLKMTILKANEIALKHHIDVAISSPKPADGQCPQIFRPIITSDGSVLPCSALAYHRNTFVGVEADGSIVEQKGAMERLSFGSILEMPFYDIWMSEAYQYFRNRVSSGDFPPLCANCLIKHDIICPNRGMSLTEYANQL